jgi:hypothetical protein
VFDTFPNESLEIRVIRSDEIIQRIFEGYARAHPITRQFKLF